MHQTHRLTFVAFNLVYSIWKKKFIIRAIRFYCCCYSEKKWDNIKKRGKITLSLSLTISTAFLNFIKFLKKKFDDELFISCSRRRRRNWEDSHSFLIVVLLFQQQQQQLLKDCRMQHKFVYVCFFLYVGYYSFFFYFFFRFNFFFEYGFNFHTKYLLLRQCPGLAWPGLVWSGPFNMWFG